MQSRDTPEPRPITEPRPLRKGSGDATRRYRARFVGGLAFVLSALGAARSQAQMDLNPAAPDVLLLVDTSGSMEYKVGSTSFPNCSPTGSGLNEKSRWIELVEVLTGTIANYRCHAVDRTSSSFRTGQYGTGGPVGQTPYDYLYVNPYHRPLSGTCALGPGTLAANAYEFPASALKKHAYDNAASAACTFTQSRDGILDSYEQSFRFGLMTFDPLAHPGTGLSGTAADFPNGVKGTWSYVLGAPRTANPAACVDPPTSFEVGARNSAAPPWEGRLVSFGDPSSGSSDYYLVKKPQIENVLLASRPYGPTPIAGMLHDARDFLVNDTATDPLNSSYGFGTKSDPYVIGGCRKRFIILLTDGQPNMDMRPDCQGNLGVCPFEKAEDIALDLTQETQSIETHVIAFALSKFMVGSAEVTCNDLTVSDFDETNTLGMCGAPANAANQALQACCVLNRIAVKGGKGTAPRAHFADDREQLSRAIAQILDANVIVASRTPPVPSGGAGGSSGFRFYSSLETVRGQPWSGILQRERYGCDSDNQPTRMPVRISNSDDFAANINYHPKDRWFVSIEGGLGSDPVRSADTIRPYVPSSLTDGAGVYSGERYVHQDAGFVSNTKPEAIEVDASTCSGGLTATACRNRYLNWLVGINNGTEFSRCPTAGENCHLLGDILHSTPRVVGPPSDFLLDESYERYARLKRGRPVVLYTSTNDGFLHAFKVAATDPADLDTVLDPGPKMNELWAFVPPAVLPHLRSQYPSTHQLLLDGAPVVRDVVATEELTNIEATRFSRSQTDAKKGLGTWRTVLVQSFGTGSPAGGGYFALDVTDPVLDSANRNNNAKGPRFLWQLTKDVSGKPLFGRGGTPVITTLFFDPAGSADVSRGEEIPVAILPGGAGTLDTCTAPTRTFSDFDGFTPRPQVRCYSATDLSAGRSLTIVRLDTGQIVRTFRQSKTEVTNADLKNLVVEVNIDSPITGQPVAFPAETGAVADRVYVGDQDGRLWKVDLASVDPDLWKMDLFFDTYPKARVGDATFAHGVADGRTIMLPPVVSVDTNGDITLNVATGDQDTVGTQVTEKNYVWSLTEKTSNNRDTVTTRVNWFQPFENGERVVGAMALFNSQLFFTSYAPPASTQVCSMGLTKLWGMDYVRPYNPTGSTTPPIHQGGVPQLDPPSTGTRVQWRSGASVAGVTNAAVFGVSIAQTPSCTITATEDASDYFGYGAEQRITHVTPGKFELVMHLSGGPKTTQSDDLKASVATLPLSPPANSTRIDSWAALVE